MKPGQEFSDRLAEGYARRADTARMLAVAICTMQNPPSWDEALRIAEHLVEVGAVRK